MRFSKLIQLRVRKQRNGVDLMGDVDAAIAANVDERDATTRTSSSQRIVQRSGRTQVATDRDGRTVRRKDG
jgi:hypothetical protein